MTSFFGPIKKGKPALTFFCQSKNLKFIGFFLIDTHIFETDMSGLGLVKIRG